MATLDELPRGDNEEHGDIATLRDWYTSAYMSTQAKQHECSSIELFISKHSRIVPGGHVSNGMNIDDVQKAAAYHPVPNFLSALGSLSSPEYNDLLKRVSRIPNGIGEWRTSNDLGGLQRTIDFIVRAIDECAPFLESRSAPIVPIIAATGAIAAAAKSTDDLIAEKLNRRMFLKKLARAGAAASWAVCAIGTGKMLTPADDIAIINNYILGMEDGRIHLKKPI